MASLVISFLLFSIQSVVGVDTNNTTSSDRNETSHHTGVDVGLLFSTPEGSRGLDDMQLAPLIVACFAIVFGAVLCFAGARVLKFTALGCAFFNGAFTTASVLERVLLQTQWEGVVSWTFFFLGGLLSCLVVLSVDHADVLCVGLTAGWMLAFTCLTTFGYCIAPSDPDIVLYVLLGVLGPGIALLTFKTEPRSLYPVTSWIGSNMVTWGTGYFFGDFPNATTIKKFRDDSTGKYTLPTAWWGYLAGTIVCLLVGTCVQAQFDRYRRKPLRERPRHNHILPELVDRQIPDHNTHRQYTYAHTPLATATRHNAFV